MSNDFFCCRRCERTYPWDTREFHCACGGLFDCESVDQLPSRFFAAVQRISLGEGRTPLIPWNAGDPSVVVKMDHLMPTLSFKDRGAVLLVALAAATNAKQIVQDSSGNAGHSVAVYAARAGIACRIFVPENTSRHKIAAVRRTGAAVEVVSGSREDAATEAYQAACGDQTFYASHVYNPLFFEGTKSMAIEVEQQLSGHVPDQWLLPVGNGTLVLGVARRLAEWRASTGENLPSRIFAVQAANCAPIAAAFAAGEDDVSPYSGQPTAADGIAIAQPKRAAEVLAAIRASGGNVVVVEETTILPMQEKMQRAGWDVEPTTAATFAALELHGGAWQGQTLIPICGSGIKSS